MNQTDPLSAIIREVADDAKLNLSGEVRVIINTSKKLAVSKVPMWAFGDEHKYFMVYPQKAVGSKVHITYTEGLAAGQKVDIDISYRARCKPGLEERLALSLLDAASPGVMLEKLIIEAVNNRLGSRREAFFEDYINERRDLETALTTQALKEAGLILDDVRLIIFGQDDLEAITLGPVIFPIHFTDCDREEELTVKAELEIDEKRTIRALLNQNKPLTDLVRKTIRKYFAENISINTFCEQPNSIVIKQGLTRSLNESLKSVGRRVGFVFLDAETVCPRPFNDEIEILYKHHAYPDPIPIKVSVLMIPQDFARYRAKKSVPLRLWIEAKLKEVMNVILFGKDYIDLLIEFDPLQEKIKEEMILQEKIKKEMIREAAGIGYVLEQLITIPNLEPFLWLKEIFFETEEGEETFKTRISNCPVKLSVSLRAKIKDLKGIKDRLTRNEKIPDVMKKNVLHLIRTHLRSLYPERFYMRFFDFDLENHPEEIAVEKELEEEITKLLRDEFNAEITQLVLTPGQTEITEKLEKLLKGAHDFQVEIRRDTIDQTQAVSRSFKSGGADDSGQNESHIVEEVSIGSIDRAGVVSGSFRVEGVDGNGWQRFQECDSSIEKIRKRIEDSIRVELKSYVNEFLVLKSRAILATAIDLIMTEFGLRISISTVSYSLSGIKDRLDWHFRERSAEIIKGIAKLESDLIELELDGDQEKIKSTKDKLNILYSHLQRRLITEGEQPDLLGGAEKSSAADPIDSDRSVNDDRLYDENGKETPG